MKRNYIQSKKIKMRFKLYPNMGGRMDQRAKKILLQMYWHNGWREQPLITAEDFAYGKAKGVLFDAITISHDECVKKIREIIMGTTPKQFGKAFLSSLSTRNLEWRSAIASYAIGSQIPHHTYTAIISGAFYEQGHLVATKDTCQICRDVAYGVIGESCYENADLNVLNFERIKWGGVRHGDLLYTLFDLMQFQKEEIPEPSSPDIAIFQEILQAITSCNPNDYPSALCERMKHIPGFKSTKAERAAMVEILACIGVLKPGAHDRACRGKQDWTFASDWRGEDGYDEIMINRYFGDER